MTIQIRAPATAEDWQAARRLIEEYAAALNVDLCFQNISYELDHLAQEYGGAGGAFLLAEEAGSAVGCIGLRRFTDEAGEIKRLYAAPAARGKGAGRLLTEGIIAEGRRLGYARLLLDTLPFMQDAQRLYLSLGFRPIAAYRFSPVPGTVCMELSLR